MANFVPDHSHLTWELHDLLTLINSLCYITCEFPLLLPYLPEPSEFCHLIHRPLKGNILCFSMNYSSTSVLPSSISGWLYFFHTIEVLTYEHTYVILPWLSHFITININYVDSCPIRSFLGIKDCHVVRFFLCKLYVIKHSPVRSCQHHIYLLDNNCTVIELAKEVVCKPTWIPMEEPIL